MGVTLMTVEKLVNRLVDQNTVITIKIDHFDETIFYGRAIDAVLLGYWNYDICRISEDGLTWYW